MYVCICNAVTERAIRHAAAEGVRSIDELTLRTGCSGTCGCCRELAIQVLEQAVEHCDAHAVAA
jgi:bacterioferritin-associated ferredoxin